MNPSILIKSGRYFHFNDPSNSEFTIEDVAHGLSHVCRFGGHCREFYSVAQHSMIASCIVPENWALRTLMHDAHEAFIGDMPSPLKVLLPDYRRIESEIQAAVLARFGIPFGIGRDGQVVLGGWVKQADLILLATERRDLMPEGPAGDDEWACLQGIRPLDIRIEPMSPHIAREKFLQRWHQLTRPQNADTPESKGFGNPIPKGESPSPR